MSLRSIAATVEAGDGGVDEWVLRSDGEADAFEERSGDGLQNGEWQGLESDQLAVFGR